MRITKPRIVKLYLVFVLCMASDVFIRIFSGSPSSSGKATFFHSDSSNPILLGFTMALIAWTCILALPVHRRVVNRLLSVPWFTAIYLEAALSVMWSVDPAATFRYGIYLWVYMLAGLIASLYLDIAEVIDIVGNTLCAMAALSIFAQYHYPQQNAAPGWTGIYGEKNHLGIGMAIGIIALCLPRARWTLLRIGKILLCFALLLLSQSGTSFICTIFAIALLICLRAPGRLRRVFTPLLSGTTIIAFAVIPNLLDRLLALGGKDSTLTGRDVIWRFAIQQWLHRPILGWGFSAFWNSQDALIQQNLGWNPSYSHNGFLEVALTLGIVGDLIILGVLMSATTIAVRVRRRSSELAGTWLLLSLAILLLHDLTEVDFLIPAPLWVVFGLAFHSAVAVQKKAAVFAPQAMAIPQPAVFSQASPG
jgi:exopolysaccharide production protein ExoQ